MADVRVKKSKKGGRKPVKDNSDALTDKTGERGAMRQEVRVKERNAKVQKRRMQESKVALLGDKKLPEFTTENINNLLRKLALNKDSVLLLMDDAEVLRGWASSKGESFFATIRKPEAVGAVVKAMLDAVVQARAVPVEKLGGHLNFIECMSKAFSAFSMGIESTESLVTCGAVNMIFKLLGVQDIGDSTRHNLALCVGNIAMQSEEMRALLMADAKLCEPLEMGCKSSDPMHRELCMWCVSLVMGFRKDLGMLVSVFNRFLPIVSDVIAEEMKSLATAESPILNDALDVIGNALDGVPTEGGTRDTLVEAVVLNRALINNLMLLAAKLPVGHSAKAKSIFPLVCMCFGKTYQREFLCQGGLPALLMEQLFLHRRSGKDANVAQDISTGLIGLSVCKKGARAILVHKNFARLCDLFANGVVAIRKLLAPSFKSLTLALVEDIKVGGEGFDRSEELKVLHAILRAYETCVASPLSHSEMLLLVLEGLNYVFSMAEADKAKMLAFQLCSVTKIKDKLLEHREELSKGGGGSSHALLVHVMNLIRNIDTSLRIGEDVSFMSIMAAAEADEEGGGGESGMAD